MRVPPTLWRAAALCTLLALAAVALAQTSAASSYSGSGDWVVSVNENVVGESVNVSGNVSVTARLTLINSSLRVDRNITVSGNLTAMNSTLAFTVDGPGTNFLSVGSGASFNLLDNDNSPLTPGDGSLLTTDKFGFNSTFGALSRLTIRNSRVENAGWSVAAPFDWRSGFRMDDADRPTVSGATFASGFEVFTITSTDNVTISNSSFDGVVTGVNLTGGNFQRFDNLSFTNHTYGLRLRLTVIFTVTGIRAGATAPFPFDPAFAPPRGTAVAIEAGGAGVLTSIESDGAVGALVPRFSTGFFIRNSTQMKVDGFTGSWGEAAGHVLASSNIDLRNFVVSYFDQPLDISSCSNVSITNFRGSDERSAIAARASADLVLRSISGQSLLVPLLDIGASLGSFSLVGADVSDSVALALIAGNATSVSFQNVSLTNVSYGVLANLANAASPSIAGVFARQIGRNLIDLTFQNVTDFFATDFDTDSVGGILLNFTAATAEHPTIARFSTNNTTDDVARFSVALLSNLTVIDLTAKLNLAAFVRIETNASADLTIRNLASMNSSGIMVLINGGSIERLSITNLSLASGDQPPPTGPPASIVLDATGQGGGHLAGSNFSAVVDGFIANVSNRGAVYASFDGAGSLSIANLDLYNLQVEGVRVLSGGSAWNLSITNVTFLASNATAVRLWQVSGPVVRDILAEAATAVEFQSVTHGLVENVTQTGDYAALHLDQSSDIVARYLHSVGGFGVDSSGGARLSFFSITAQASAWAVRAASAFDVTVDGLDATNSVGGVAFLGVTRGTITNTSIEFAGSGIQVAQGSSSIALGPITASSPTGVTAGTLLKISFGTSISVSQLSFSGRCTVAAQVEYSTGVSLDRLYASACGEGLSLATVRMVTVTDLWIPGTFTGSALTVSDSTDVRIVRANISGAADTAILATDVDRFFLTGIDATLAAGDGALLAYLANTSIDGANFDGPSGACLRILKGLSNITISNITARRGLAGIEVLSSPGVVVENANASLNGGMGLYSDPLSPNVVLRNITASNNLWNGIFVSANGTRFIDGNISGNGQPGIASAPSIRLDWLVQGIASLTDERCDLTGDLTISPGGRLTLARTNFTVDQTARRRAFQPYTRIQVLANATLWLDSSVLSARDVRTPYSVDLSQGAQFTAFQSLVMGSSAHDGTSSINASGASVLALGSDFLGWYAPLNTQGGTFDCGNCTFRLNTNGPSFHATTLTMAEFSSFDNEFDGLTVEGSPLISSTNAFVWFNGAMGAVFDSVPYLQLNRFEALSNGLGGVRITHSNLTASELRLSGPNGPGLVVDSSQRTSIAGLWSQANPGLGARFQDVADLNLSAVDVYNNGATGIELERVGRARITDGRIGRSALFGLHVIDAPDVAVERVAFDGDVGAALRAESGAVVTIGNASVVAAGDYAVVLIADAQATLVNLTLNGTLTGLLATDNSFAFVLNCTARSPTVLSSAVVRIGWFLRVLVQDPAGYPAPATRVQVADATNATVANASTGPSGATPLIAVIERALFANGRSVWFGPQEVTARHDWLGRASASLNITRYTALGLRLDNVTPQTTVSLDGPEGENGWFVGPVTVTFAAVDDHAAGLFLFWRAAGSSWQQAQSDGSTVSSFVRIGTEGRTTVEFYAVDAAGNAEAVQAVVVSVDLTAPTASFAALDDVVFGSPVPLSWSGTDGPGSGVLSFDVDSSLEGAAFQGWQNGTTQRQGGFVGPEGHYQFRAVAHDASGHTSPPAFLRVTSVIYGILRLNVVDSSGAPVPSVTVTIVSQNVTKNGTGTIEVAGLLPGNFTVRLSAPGYEAREFEANVSAGAVSEVGAIEMTRLPSSRGIDLTAGYLVLAALVVLTAAYYVRMRQRWARRRRDRERQEKAARDESKEKRRKPPGGKGPLEAKPVEERADGGSGGGPDGDQGK